MAAPGTPRLVGMVNDEREPFVNVTVAGPRRQVTLSCLVDTGFDGGVILPSRLVTALGLSPVRSITALLADGSTARLPAYEGEVDWLRGRRQVEVLGAATDTATVGASLFGEHRLTVDYPARFVEIV